MKTILKKSVLLWVIGAAVMVSCSKETQIQEETESSFELFDRGGTSLDIVKITIVWYDHVKEDQKKARRTEFEEQGILKYYEECSVNPKNEIWFVAKDEHDEDLPIKTDPCPDGPPDETERAPTDDDEPEDCDIRRVLPTPTCED